MKVNITKRNTTCNNDDGYIKITPTGGQLPITYELENKSLGSKNEWTNLSGGTYKYRVKDAKDDSITGEIVILGLKSPIILAIESICMVAVRYAFIKPAVPSSLPPKYLTTAIKILVRSQAII